jgi:hypothetical protein
MRYIAFFVLWLIIATPAFAQLSTPQIGKFAQEPLIYYRVGFVSKHKHLTEIEVNNLLDSLKNSDISETYVFQPKQSTDGTYEIEMLVRIIFFDKKEAESAKKFLLYNPQFDPSKFDIEVVECKNQ